MRTLLRMAGFVLSLYLVTGLLYTTRYYFIPAVGAPMAVFAYSLVIIPVVALAEACLFRRFPVLIPPLMFAMLNMSYWWSVLLARLGFGDHFFQLGMPRDLIGLVLWLPSVGLAFFFAHWIADLANNAIRRKQGDTAAGSSRR